MRTVSIPCTNRTSYLSACLESLIACPGFHKWKILAVVDGVKSDAPSLVRKMIPTARVLQQPARYGIDVNTMLAVEWAFGEMGSKFNVYLEEDMVVSRDFLKLSGAYADAINVGMCGNSMLCFRRWEKNEKSGNPHVIERANEGLLGNGFAIASTVWAEIRGMWLTRPGWDWSLSDGLEASKIVQLRPGQSRTRSIGLSGTNTCSTGKVPDQNLFGPMFEGFYEGEFRFPG